ncbi:MAG: fumarylacetoacetate hydrolase family protein [Asticcacaulis sp.]
MKFMRVGPVGHEKPCVQDKDGVWRDLSQIVKDINTVSIGPALKASVANADLSTLPVVDATQQRIGSPMAQPRNIYCIGLNYSDHAAEAGLPVPPEPIIFSKASGTFCGPNDSVLFSPAMTKLDWEVELGIVIGKAALNISEDEAEDHIFGYCVVNDVSERAWQMERAGQWIKGKSFPSFCPTGPWLVTTEDVPDPEALDLWLDVNGISRQKGSTSKMIFSPKHIVAYMSQFCRLEPGDLICTGTPPGVGAGMTPPLYLKIDDEIRLGIQGLGEQHQHVVAL